MSDNKRIRDIISNKGYKEGIRVKSVYDNKEYTLDSTDLRMDDKHAIFGGVCIHNIQNGKWAEIIKPSSDTITIDNFEIVARNRGFKVGVFFKSVLNSIRYIDKFMIKEDNIWIYIDGNTIYDKKLKIWATVLKAGEVSWIKVITKRQPTYEEFVIEAKDRGFESGNGKFVKSLFKSKLTLDGTGNNTISTINPNDDIIYMIDGISIYNYGSNTWAKILDMPQAIGVDPIDTGICIGNSFNSVIDALNDYQSKPIILPDNKLIFKEEYRLKINSKSIKHKPFNKLIFK